MLRLILVGLIVGVVAVGGMFARRIYTDSRAPAGSASLHVGGRTLNVERAMIRNRDLHKGGAVNRLDLVLRWPDLSGALALVGQKDAPLLFVTVEDAAPLRRGPDDIDPADRPVELYARFLESEAEPGPGTLVIRRFRKNTPYEGEELYLSTPDERLFSARCPISGSPGALAGDLCLWQARINGLELHSRFPAAYLGDWQTMTAGVAALARRIGAEGQPAAKKP